MSINMNNLVIWSNIDLIKYFTKYGSAWHQENKKKKPESSVYTYVNDQNQKWALL